MSLLAESSHTYLPNGVVEEAKKSVTGVVYVVYENDKSNTGNLLAKITSTGFVLASLMSWYNPSVEKKY